MNAERFLIYIPIGTLVMLLPIIVQGSIYRVKLWKRFVTAILLAAAGTLGTMLLFYVENGSFEGTSFFGAIFFVPILFLPVAWSLKIPYGHLMDLCGPAECAMLVIMKVQCYLTGCCGGIELAFQGKRFVFPSQLAELVTALVIGLLLLWLSGNRRNRGKIYPWYMILYGATRFVLNMFRKTGFVSVLHMPFGNFWSLVSVAIGLVWWIWVSRSRKKTETP